MRHYTNWVQKRNIMNRTEQTDLNLSMVLVRIPYTWQIPSCLSSSGWWPWNKAWAHLALRRDAVLHCSGPEAITLPHDVPLAKAHCCRFMANMISPLTAVISRSPGPVWLWSLTLCQSKLVILQYWLLLSPCRVLSKNKHGFVYALCLHENSHMLSLSCFTRVTHVNFEPTVPLLLWRAASLLYD